MSGDDAQRAFLDAHRRICPECGRSISLTRGGVRLSPHNRLRDAAARQAPVQRCPGSRMDVADVDRRNAEATS